MRKINKSDIINFGLDYIEVKGTSEKIEKVEFPKSALLNSKDNDYIISELFPGFQLKKTIKVINYSYKIIFKKDGFDCFAYHKGMTNGKITTDDFISVYGVAFKIFKDINQIFDFLNKNFGNKKIKRFDLAIDIHGFTVQDINSKIFRKRKRKVVIFLIITETYKLFIYERKKRTLNKYKLLRCYNKIDDIIAKKRQVLYVDYLKRAPITRIEFEFRTELTKDVFLNDLLDQSYIFGLFLTYINTYTDLFSNFKYEKIKLSRLIKNIDINELKTNEIVKNKYVQTFLGYSKTLLFIGTCPIKILLEKNLISKQTKEDILNNTIGGTFYLEEFNDDIIKRTSKEIKFNNLFLESDKNE